MAEPCDRDPVNAGKMNRIESLPHGREQFDEDLKVVGSVTICLAPLGFSHR